MLGYCVLPYMNTLEAPSDNDLIARVLAGNDGAFSDLITRHWAKIFARASQLLDDLQDAEEVTQDAFSRAYKHLSNFRGDAAFSTWLYQIVTNLARNRFWFVMRRGQGRRVSLSDPLRDGSHQTWESTIPCQSYQPSEQASLGELRDSIQSIIPVLPAIYGEVLHLRVNHELSYEGISEAMNLPLGTIKSRLARARKVLLEQLPDGILEGRLA